MSRPESAKQSQRPASLFPYEEFMRREDIPIVEAMCGVDDVTQLPRKPWPRTGGSGTFIQMRGTFQSERGIYVAEIPGGGELNPERHLYEEEIFILQGRGLTEVSVKEGKAKTIFEWTEGSVFALPRNSWHKLINGGREPVIFMAVTTAPRVMNALVDIDVVFNCDYEFPGEFVGQPGYFKVGDERVKEGRFSTIWYTRFIPDARAEFLDDLEQKVAGGQLTGYKMGKEFPHGHISEWPVGRYHKAHYHGPGAILIGLKGKGYVLLWPRELGTRPYQDGHEDKVMKVEWGPRSIYCPPDAWFHQHFSTGKEPARHVAVYGGRVPMSSARTVIDRGDGNEFSGYVSFREGGTLIDYEDEDPEIRRRFAEKIQRDGIELKMPPVKYRPH